MRNLIGVAAALGATLYFATPIPAIAGSANQEPGWGTVVGAGILGGILGGAAAQPPVVVVAPAPQVIIIQPGQPAPPAPRVVACPNPIPGASHVCGTPLPANIYWCKPLKHAYPIVQQCPTGFQPMAFYFWCDPLRGWYPYVGESCPGGWRQISFPPGTIP
jgi:hypothetical protein